MLHLYVWFCLRKTLPMHRNRQCNKIRHTEVCLCGGSCRYDWYEGIDIIVLSTFTGLRTYWVWGLVWTSPLTCCINHLTSQGLICTMRRLDQITSSRPVLPPSISMVMKGGRLAWSMEHGIAIPSGPWCSSRVNHLRRVWYCEMYAIFLSFNFFQL